MCGSTAALRGGQLHMLQPPGQAALNAVSYLLQAECSTAACALVWLCLHLGCCDISFTCARGDSDRLGSATSACCCPVSQHRLLRFLLIACVLLLQKGRHPRPALVQGCDSSNIKRGRVQHSTATAVHGSSSEMSS